MYIAFSLVTCLSFTPIYQPNQDLLSVILKLSAKFTVNGFSILSWTNPYVSDLGVELPPCVTHSFGVKVPQELLLLISLRPSSSVFFKSCNLILRFFSRSFSPWRVSFRRIFDLEMILLNVPWNYKKDKHLLRILNFDFSTNRIKKL